jgi:hypothetical protein
MRESAGQLCFDEACRSISMLLVPCPGLPMSEKPLAFEDIENSTGLYVGGQVRLAAAAEFSIRFKPRAVVVVGGITAKERFRQTAAARQFILERNADANVIAINSLPCTRHNVIAIFNQLGSKLQGERTGVLTNSYHLPRFLAFWSDLQKSFGLNLGPPMAIPAGSISANPLMHGVPYQKRMDAEAAGLADLRAGKYVDRCLDRLDLFRDEVVQHPDWYLAPEERTDACGPRKERH